MFPLFGRMFAPLPKEVNSGNISGILEMIPWNDCTFGYSISDGISSNAQGAGFPSPSLPARVTYNRMHVTKSLTVPGLLSMGTGFSIPPPTPHPALLTLRTSVLPTENRPNSFFVEILNHLDWLFPETFSLEESTTCCKYLMFFEERVCVIISKVHFHVNH